MRGHQLFAAGISVAVLLGGAASPVLAHESKPAGPRIKGKGRTAEAAHVSVSVRADRLEKGRFDWRSRDGRFKVRCEGFDSYSQRVYIQPGPPAAVVKSSDCVLKGPRGRTPVTVEAEFVDNSSFTPGAKDEANLTFTRRNGSQISDSGAMRSGDITVR
ncbi:MAG TPA: hypothetical protein VG795_03310 [Acidimicrobiia bacterium]|nr:hypothetical protein [Acidimicrobiia bacterium]